MTSWRSGDQTAVELGRLLAVESWLHQQLGEASRAAQSPALVCLLDERSMLHASHVELLTDHLPRRDGVDRASLLVLGELEPVVEQLRDLAGDAATLLVAYREVLVVRVIEAVISLEVGCSDAAERSLRRSLGMVLKDLEDSLDPLDATLGSQRVVRSPLPPAVAAFAQRCTEVVGPLGLVS